MNRKKVFENGVPVYYPIPVDFSQGTSEMIRLWDENQKRVMEIDKEGKVKGELLGRMIMEPVADGKACYQIVKVNKRTVRIKSVKGIGDDYTVPYWGDEASIERSYAENHIAYRDRLDALFSR